MNDKSSEALTHSSDELMAPTKGISSPYSIEIELKFNSLGVSQYLLLGPFRQNSETGTKDSTRNIILN